MSNEISNRVLASLLVVAIVISVIGTLFSLNRLGDLSSITGRQVYNDTQTSTTNLTILGVVGITVAGTINFGSGVTNESTSINLTTDSVNSNGFTDCTGASACAGITVQNTGNVNAKVVVNSSRTAATLLGGTNPVMLYYATDGTTGGANTGCTNNITYPTGNKNTLNSSLQNLCTLLNYTDGNDYVTFEMLLKVPSDAPPVSNSQATLTFFATQS